MGLVGFCRVALALITVDFGLLVGSSVVMGPPPGLWRLLMLIFWTIYLVLFGFPEGSGESLVAGTIKMRYCSANFW